MNRQFFEDFCSGDMIVMPKPRFVQEHKKLLQVLERKNPKELEAERKEQAKELKEQLKKPKRGALKGKKE